MTRKYNALNDLPIDLAKSGICKEDGLRFTDPACTHATPEQIAYTIAYDSPPKYASYKDKHVIGEACPKCGGLLIVKERRLRVRDSADYVANFVGCANFETRGCKHTETFTETIRATIDAVVYDEEPGF